MFAQLRGTNTPFVSQVGMMLAPASDHAIMSGIENCSLRLGAALVLRLFMSVVERAVFRNGPFAPLPELS